MSKLRCIYCGKYNKKDKNSICFECNEELRYIVKKMLNDKPKETYKLNGAII